MAARDVVLRRFLLPVARQVVLLLCSAASVFALPQRSLAEEGVDFNRDIRPLLAEHCLRCHGPDDAHRQADLRLDTPEGLVGDLGGRYAVVPGNPDKSELILRVESADDDLRMPPPEAKRRLTSDEAARLRAWVTQGAAWSVHWAFVPPAKPPIPSADSAPTSRSATIYNPIDVFIQSRLAQEGLAPSPLADRATLIRRVSLDLTGLPPTPDETAAFVADEGPGAYERIVDRLLADPQYGERWARPWLDLARYADTNGYEKDRERSAWPYRDWVIRAMNEDLPFDQFTVEQIAGDLLPNATLSQKIATGFHRNTMLNEEGGIDPLEYRYYAMVDRVATTGAAWLGLTVGCAQCHTHKHDPISQREYYGIMACLNNADDVDVSIPDAAALANHRERLREAEKLQQELPSHWPAATAEGEAIPPLEREFEDWLVDSRARVVEWTHLVPTAAASDTLSLEIGEDGVVFVHGDSTKSDRYRLTFEFDPTNSPPLRDITAIRLDALPDARLPGGGPGLGYYEGPKGDFRLKELRLTAEGAPVDFSRATCSDVVQRWSQKPQPLPSLFDGKLTTGFSFRDAIKGSEFFPDGLPVMFVVELQGAIESPRTVQLEMDFDHYYSSALGKFRVSATEAKGELGAYNFSPETERLLRKSDDQLTIDERAALRNVFLMESPRLRDHAAKIDELRKPPQLPQSQGMSERPARFGRATRLQTRGEFTLPGELVDPHAPAALRFPETLNPRNRLELAHWLTSDENPLTARVWVNRQWAALFGRGLVHTLDDFGAQGERPTHPELLDWLARCTVEREWSPKALHRLMVTSYTYQQSANATDGQRQADPQNLLLSRMTRRRLEGEAVRDAVLAASGLLSWKAGGPGVRPPQPDGVVDNSVDTAPWKADDGENRFRRSVYTFQKRTAPFAMFAAFDAPSGEACVARRDVSNTPLQALTMLNDVMFMEASRALGEILASQRGTDADKIATGYQRVLSRAPHAKEVELLGQFVASQRTDYAHDRDAARMLAGVAQPCEREVELAAWTAVARTLFNLDELLYRN